jgi:hypothetical protein
MGATRRRSTKGTRSKTHRGRKNYTTKKGDKVFHRKRHYVRKSRKPYSKKRGGMNYMGGMCATGHVGGKRRRRRKTKKTKKGGKRRKSKKSKKSKKHRKSRKSRKH